MSSAPESATDGAATACKFTDEGLPLERALWGAAVAGEDGPSRRIDCRPPSLLSASSIRASKDRPSRARRPIPLAVGPNESSLIDDDDDELVDYFGVNANPVASPDSPTVTAPSSARWDVHERNVPSLPPFYPLDKSSVCVPRSPAPALADRIAAVLQARSIAATYDAPSCKVDCVSKSHVEFRVRLYRGMQGCDRVIIVEVQRRSGFSLNYAQDVRAILDAAKGKSVEDLREKSMPIYHEDGDGSADSREEDVYPPEHTAEFASLQIISDILRPHGGEAEEVFVERRDLALSSLASLTNLIRMGRAAVHFSNELLSSEAHADLRRHVFSNVGRDPANWRPVLLSLEILANVAASAQSQSPLVKFFSESDHAILRKLIANIENAVLGPHAADLSCLILKHTYKSGVAEDTMPSHYRERMSVALMRAVAHGDEFHTEMAEHSQQCLGLIERI